MKNFIKKAIKKAIYFIFSRFIKMYGDSTSIYITFDDGPHPENTLKILKTLKQYDVKATFFMTGKDMLLYKDVVVQLLNEGHQVGYHSFAHESNKVISIRQFIDDLNNAKEIGKEFGINMILYRPPYGDLTFLSLIVLAYYGWVTIMWSKDSMDSFETEEEVIVNVESKNLNKGEIVLFHDDYSKTANILSKVLEGYNQEKIKCGLFLSESDFKIIVN